MSTPLLEDRPDSDVEIISDGPSQSLDPVIAPTAPSQELDCTISLHLAFGVIDVQDKSALHLRSLRSEVVQGVSKSYLKHLESQGSHSKLSKDEESAPRIVPHCETCTCYTHVTRTP